MLKGFKTRLNFTKEQEILAAKHAGIARSAYNWGVEVCRKSYEETKKVPSGFDLGKKHVKEVKSVNSYFYEVSNKSAKKSLLDVDVAYKNFHNLQKKSNYSNFKEIKKNGVVIKKELKGLPQFKKKGVNDSFYLEGSTDINYGIKIENNKIKLPKFGWVKLYEKNIQLTSPIKNVTISRKSNQWFISFKQEFEPIHIIKTEGIVGVDLGIKTLATCSNGKIFPSIKPFKKYKRKLKILQRRVSKKFLKGASKQSNNYKKAQLKVSKLHLKISNIRQDYTHKITSHLTKNHSEIVIEDLNIKGMSKNHKLASAILDGGWYEFRRQLSYKSEWYGSKLTVVNRFYPSSKTCSNCNEIKKDLKLKDRVFCCSKCGHKIDRDLNASMNLKKMAVGYIASTCGETQTNGITPLVSMKQEMNVEKTFV